MAKDELEESDGTYAESGTPRPSGRAPADRSQEKPELPETTETAVSTQTEKDVSTQPKEYEQSEAEWEHGIWRVLLTDALHLCCNFS